jgi:alpha-galactosidase
MRPNPRLFLEGMKSFCDEIHSKGLRCGLYTGFAPMVCGFQNGSWGYETIDANTFASWGSTW